MILLQSKDVFEDILRINPLSGEMWELKRSDSPELAEEPINGTFANIGGKRLMFYRLEGGLRFSVDGEELAIDSDVGSSLESQGGERIFRLMKGGRELLRFDYKIEDLEEMIPGDITPFIEEEDFDFCLFVHHVLNNPEKRNFIYQ